MAKLPFVHPSAGARQSLRNHQPPVSKRAFNCHAFYHVHLSLAVQDSRSGTLRPHARWVLSVCLTHVVCRSSIVRSTRNRAQVCIKGRLEGHAVCCTILQPDGCTRNPRALLHNAHTHSPRLQNVWNMYRLSFLQDMMCCPFRNGSMQTGHSRSRKPLEPLVYWCVHLG